MSGVAPERIPLQRLLEATPHRTLVAIARTTGLPGHARSRKADLVSCLEAGLLAPERLARDYAGFGDEARVILRTMAHFGGSLARPSFEARFGSLPEHRPWRDDAPARPWKNPASPAARLRFAGWLFQLPAQREGVDAHVVVPAEMLDWLAQSPLAHEFAETGHEARNVPGRREPGRAIDPAHDLAWWLAYVISERPPLMHGRWLALSHLRRIGRRLDPPADLGEARSELQCGRLRMTHYLAEALGLVELDDGRLRVAEHAVAWLARPRAEQLRAMWDAWLDEGQANDARWRRFQLPGYRTAQPALLVRTLVERLAQTGCGDGRIPDLSLEIGTDRDGAALDPVLWLDEPLEALVESLARDCLEPIGAASWHAIGRWDWTIAGRWMLAAAEASEPIWEGGGLTIDADALLRPIADRSPAGIVALAHLTTWTETGLRLDETAAQGWVVERGMDPTSARAQALACMVRYLEPSAERERSIATLMDALQTGRGHPTPIDSDEPPVVGAGRERLGLAMVDVLARRFGIGEGLGARPKGIADEDWYRLVERATVLLDELRRLPVQERTSPGGAAEPGAVLELVEAATVLGAPILIEYRKPGLQQPELRRIRPRAVEWQGARVLVRGWCMERRAERSFRMDRIETARAMAMMPVEQEASMARMPASAADVGHDR